jgi:EAL domain-containing protein (putative c-di-GMP-specific phosphodiesterase class I)
MRLASAPTVFPHVDAASAELSASQAERLIAHGPTIEEPEVEKFFARLRAFPVALVAQPLAPLQRGMRVRRYEVFLRDASSPASEGAPLSLLRAADDRGLGSVLDRRVAGALIVWLAGRKTIYADEPAQFSLNLSASSLADPNFLRFVELCLTKSGIPSGLLAVEVDQAFWRKDRICLQRLSRGLETLGAGLVIDNVTFSDELADLLSLPAVRLAKIDRRLTQGLAGNRQNQMRVAGMAQIARVAGILSRRCCALWAWTSCRVTGPRHRCRWMSSIVSARSCWSLIRMYVMRPQGSQRVRPPPRASLLQPCRPSPPAAWQPHN